MRETSLNKKLITIILSLSLLLPSLPLNVFAMEGKAETLNGTIENQMTAVNGFVTEETEQSEQPEQTEESSDGDENQTSDETEQDSFNQTPDEDEKVTQSESDNALTEESVVVKQVTGNESVVNGEKPKVELQLVRYFPEQPLVGDEITFQYQITPYPFQHTIYVEQEVVLMLDMSNSMQNGEVDQNGNFTTQRMIDAINALRVFLESVKDVENLKVGLVVYNGPGKAVVSLEKANELGQFVEIENYLNNIVVCPKSTYTLTNKNDGKYKIAQACRNYHDNKSVEELEGAKKQFLESSTNIGDGMRQAAAMLKAGSSTAKKSIISMTDGAPHGWTVVDQDNKFYEEITSIVAEGKNHPDKSKPRYTAQPGAKALEYAIKIGNKIKELKNGNNEPYTMYSIGFDLNDDRKGNLRDIHTAAGGVSENIVVNATSENISDVYEGIANQIKETYNIDTAQANLDLDESFKATDGFDATLGDNKIKINPIIYELDRETMWYKAEPQLITFKVKANKEGEYTIFGDSSTLTYRDIFGKLVTVDMSEIEVTVTTRPYIPEEAEKLDVSLRADQNGYLIGDPVKALLAVTKRDIKGVTHDNVKFELAELPHFLEYANGSVAEKNFGSITESLTEHTYEFTINDDNEITTDEPFTLYLNGQYDYDISKDGETKHLSGENTEAINVKRGQVKVKVTADNNMDITDQVVLTIQGASGDKLTGRYDNGYFVFDALPTDNYAITLDELPFGCEVAPTEKEKYTRIDYTHNLDELEFIVAGTPQVVPPTINAILEKQQYDVEENEEVDVTYTIDPQPFQYGLTGSKALDVVLVVDSTDSTEGFSNTLKNALVTNLIHDTQHLDVRYGLITYSDELEETLELTDNYEKIIKEIRDYELEDEKDSNGKGINDTYDEINKLFDDESVSERDTQKVVIFMTEGKINAKNLDKINDKGYRFMTLDLGEGQGSNTIKQMHDELNANLNDYFSVSSETAEEVSEKLPGTISQIANQLINVVSPIISFNPTLNFNLGDKIQLVSPDITIQQETNGQSSELKASKDSITSDGNKITIKLPTINYELNDKNYVADSFKVTFKLKVTQPGRNITFSNPNEIQYQNIHDEEVKRAINTPIFNVRAGYAITIQVDDTAGDIDHLYDSRDELFQDTLLNRFNKEYNLYGDAFADIQIRGEELNHLKYQIIESDHTPNFPEGGWSEYTVGKDGIINDDIDLDAPGHLTQKSYDVNHMPNLSDTTKWSDPEEVFKHPFSAVEYKPTSLSTTKDQYVTQKTCLDINSKPKNCWETKSIFTEKQSIGRDYKEATKSWGYFKAPETGYYKFRVYTDDGMIAMLTREDGSQYSIVDSFKPQTANTPHIAEQSVYLEQGQFYPIYIEYFNWGGDAAFKYEYQVSESESDFSDNGYQIVPQDAFYPSKSKNPGEGGNNIFVGQKGIKFPEDVGRYYVLYQAGSIDEDGENFTNILEGVYGPFNVEDRFDLTRELEEPEIPKQGDELTLLYTLNPRAIEATDLYKTEDALNGQLKSTLTITGTKVYDVIPSALKFKDIIHQDKLINHTVTGTGELEATVNGEITYTLQKNGMDRKNWKYVANEIEFEVITSAVSSGDVKFDEEDGVITYNDVTLKPNTAGAMKESYFAPTQFEIEASSEIIEYGFYTNTAQDFIQSIPEDAELTKDAPYTFGLTMDIKASTSSFTIEIPQELKDANITILEDSVKLYELNEEAGKLTVVKDSELKLTSTQLEQGDTYVIASQPEDAEAITLEKGTKYLLVYRIQLNDSINSVMLNNLLKQVGVVDYDKEEIQFNLHLNDKGEIELPDLL